MRRRPSPEHQQAVSRRLALLSAELATVRPPAAAPWGQESPDDATNDDPDHHDPDHHDLQQDWTAEHTRIATRPRLPTASGPAPFPGPPSAPTSGPPPARPARPPELPLPELPVPELPVPELPVPGRHAARRPGGLLTDVVPALVPATLRGRAGMGPAQVAVLAVLVALGLAVTSWWVLRGRPREVAAPLASASAPALTSLPSDPPVAAAPPSGAGPVTASATGAGGTVTVDVEGKVHHPGIVVLDAGSRVVDALARAGGARPGADLAGLNLARVLVDGEQVLVGLPAAAVATTGPAPPVPGAPGAALVNLNTATETELEALPEVGPVTAQSILTWRDEHGGFSSVDELLEVDGIGDATLSRLAPLVTV